MGDAEGVISAICYYCGRTVEYSCGLWWTARTVVSACAARPEMHHTPYAGEGILIRPLPDLHNPEAVEKWLAS